MLAELVISNFALVENETFNFSEGLNMLTGETGAGKSLILDAIGFLMGASLRDKPLRSGAASGFVTARFVELPEEVKARAEELGFELSEDGELLMSRDLKAAGRAYCRVNGKPAALASMRELGSLLVDLHGQHQQYSLLKAADHLKVLDRYIASKEPGYGALQASCAAAFKNVRDLTRELQELREGERSRLRDIDWARHEAGEIAAVDPQPGEDKALEHRIRVLTAASDLRNGALEAHEHLSTEGGVREGLARECDVLSSLLSKDESLEPILKGLREALAVIDDNIYELSSYAEGITDDAAVLEELNGRYELLKSIMRKYGPEIEDVIAYREQAEERLRKLESSEARSGSLEKELAAAFAGREKIMDEVSALRHRYACELAKEVEEELVLVGMPSCRFEVSFADNSTCNPAADSCAGGLVSKYRTVSASGGDEAEFLIAPNPGEAPKPLAMIASGGEISRIMLAMLSLFSEFQKTATFFFDEIDAGLGGAAAQAVAGRLRGLASRSQVICITHLAVLAVAGQRHHHIYKEVSGGRTSAHVILLEGAEREKEIARMLSGDASSEQALEHARSLLQAAGN